MEKLYIKFIEGNEESLKKACDIAESLGYKKYFINNALNFEGEGILELNGCGTYCTSVYSDIFLISMGFKEYVQKEKNIYVIFGGNKTPTNLSSAEEEAKRLCKKENKPFYVCKILAKYENVVILSDNVNL